MNVGKMRVTEDACCSLISDPGTQGLVISSKPSIFPSLSHESRVDALRVCTTFGPSSRNVLFRGSRLVLSNKRDEH